MATLTERRWRNQTKEDDGTWDTYKAMVKWILDTNPLLLQFTKVLLPAVPY